MSGLGGLRKVLEVEKAFQVSAVTLIATVFLAVLMLDGAPSTCSSQIGELLFQWCQSGGRAEIAVVGKWMADK